MSVAELASSSAEVIDMLLHPSTDRDPGCVGRPGCGDDARDLDRSVSVRVGVVKELKRAERRVALMPAGALSLVRAGHEALVEAQVRAGSKFDESAYAAGGARVASADKLWEQADLPLK